jgi:crossover junction endodeoxyribonuclease RuvC
MVILGIDPGYERLGIALLRSPFAKASNDRQGFAGQAKPEVIYSDCFRTNKDDEHADRLFQIQEELERVIQKYKPEKLGIESLFFTTNQKTAIKVSEARGVVLSTAQKFGLKIKELTPLQIKVAVTGYGKSDKKAMIKMVPMLVEFKNERNACLPASRLDDEYDAICIGLTALHQIPISKSQTNSK